MEDKKLGVNAMANKTSKKSAKVAKKAAAKRVAAKAAKPRKAVAKSSARKPTKAAKPKLLSGGNPQIAKADGDAPVQAYIAAMPGWKRDVGRRLDALIVRTVPNVRKAVRWNTPFYGIEGQGWFLGFHCITKYVKVAFFRGASLRPLPPVESKQKDVRYFHIHEDDQLDEELVASWIRQASELPGGSCNAGLKLPADRSVLGLEPGLSAYALERMLENAGRYTRNRDETQRDKMVRQSKTLMETRCDGTKC